MSANRLLQGFPQPSNLNRLTPLREQIYQLLRSAIVNGRMKPGQSVEELEIADRLGISRTPVREAVKKLSDEGLINVVAQSGTRVASIERKQVEEAYIIRKALELEGVARAARVITKHHTDDLEDLVDKFARAYAREAFDDAVVLDDDFHRYITEINGLSMLWRAIDISKAQTDRCSYLSSSIPSMGDQTVAEHRAVIRALKTGQEDKAVAAMRTHLDNSLRTALNLIGSVTNTPGETARRPRRRRRS